MKQPINRGVFVETPHGPGLDPLRISSGGAVAYITSGAHDSQMSLAVWEYVPPSGLCIGAALTSGTDPSGDFTCGVGLGIGAGSLDGGGVELVGIEGNVAWRATGVSVPLGWQHIAYTGNRDIDSAVFFIAGNRVATHGAAWDTNRTARINLGGEGQNASRPCGTPVGAWHAWNRVLSDVEVMQVHADPFCMLRR